MSTRNRLDLQTLGSRPISVMLKNLPNQWRSGHNYSTIKLLCKCVSYYVKINILCMPKYSVPHVDQTITIFVLSFHCLVDKKRECLSGECSEIQSVFWFDRLIHKSHWVSECFWALLWRWNLESNFTSYYHMIGENRQLVRDELVEFEKQLVEVQDCRKISDRFRGIHGIFPNSIKENCRMSTCNRLDLQTLGSPPIMPKNLPDHWYDYRKVLAGSNFLNVEL